MHYVYLIECRYRSIYTGYTNNLDRRILEHKTASPKSAKYVRAKGFKKLLHHEVFNTKSDAMKREVEIKQFTRSKKINLFKG